MRFIVYQSSKIRPPLGGCSQLSKPHHTCTILTRSPRPQSGQPCRLTKLMADVSSHTDTAHQSTTASSPLKPPNQPLQPVIHPPNIPHDEQILYSAPSPYTRQHHITNVIASHDARSTLGGSPGFWGSKLPCPPYGPRSLTRREGMLRATGHSVT